MSNQVEARTSFVMPFAGQYLDTIVDDPEHDAVCVIDADAPPSRQVMAQGLGPANAVIAVAVDALEQLMYPPKRLPVLALPSEVVLPRLLVPNLTHGQILRRESGHAPPRSAPHPCPVRDGARQTGWIPNRTGLPL